MYRPAGWVILFLGVVVAYIGYLGFTNYPASLSAIPYGDELLPFLAEGWREQRDLYVPILESGFVAWARGHPMEMMGGYGLIGLFLLLSRGYRDAGWGHFLLVLWCGIFIPILMLLGLIFAQGGIDLFHYFGGGESAVDGVNKMRREPAAWLGNLVGNLVLGIPLMLFGLVVGLAVHAAVYVVPPLYILFVLFALPSIAFVILRLLVRLPLLTYHYLHYLTVPHPAETAYRAGVAEHLPIPELARNVADAMYRYDLKDYNAFPPEWKTKNYKKRIEAFDALLKAQAGFMEGQSAAWQKEEERFMEEFIKNLRLKSQLRE
jgi:hypothetical protein